MVLRRACERRLVALGLSNEADLARLTECRDAGAPVHWRRDRFKWCLRRCMIW
jgi:Fe2+ transport system protein FeoA